MVYIDEVRKTRGRDGYDVITHVCCTRYMSLKATDWKTKAWMIDFIKRNPSESVKTKYRRGTTWVEGEDVRVIDDEFLRTDANHTRRDNLGEL